MLIHDLGILPYRDAWDIQEQAHEQVVAGGAERAFFVEHPPVITFGRRPGLEKNVLAPADQLARLGVEVVQSDRGGDVTFHGPGQLVVYPIIRLAAHGLSVGSYVQALEDAVIATLADFGVVAMKDPSVIGVWTPDPACDHRPAKICALGVRIRRGVSLHGIALNVITDLNYFRLIVPCGLADRPVTSLHQLLGPAAPTMDQVKAAMAKHLPSVLNARTMDCSKTVNSPSE